MVSTIRLECSEVAGLCNSEAYSKYVWEQCPITCNACMAESLAYENANAIANGAGIQLSTTAADGTETKQPLQLQTWVVVVIGLVTLLVVWGSIHLGVAYHHKKTQTGGKRVRGGQMEFADDFDHCWDDAGMTDQQRHRTQRGMHDLAGIREQQGYHSDHHGMPVHRERTMIPPGHHHGRVVQAFSPGFGGMTEVDVDGAYDAVHSSAQAMQAHQHMQQQQQQLLQLQQQQQQQQMQQQQQETLLKNAHREQQKQLLLAKQQNEQQGLGRAASNKEGNRQRAPVSAKVLQPVGKCTICRRWFANTEKVCADKCEDCIAMDLEFSHSVHTHTPRPTPRSKPADWSMLDIITPVASSSSRSRLFVGRQVYEWNDEVTDGVEWAARHEDCEGGCYDNIGGGSTVAASDAAPGASSSVSSVVGLSRAFGDFIDTTAAADAPAADAPAADTSAADTPAADTPAANTPAANTDASVGQRKMPSSPPLPNLSMSKPSTVASSLGSIHEEGGDDESDDDEIGDGNIYERPRESIRRATEWAIKPEMEESSSPSSKEEQEAVQDILQKPVELPASPSSPRRSALPMPLKPHGSPLAMRRHGERSMPQIRKSLLKAPNVSAGLSIASNDMKYFDLMSDDLSADI